ncbi:MAG: hypothetical protein AB1782_05425 [Cyanobacteriota bacterium]
MNSVSFQGANSISAKISKIGDRIANSPVATRMRNVPLSSVLLLSGIVLTGALAASYAQKNNHVSSFTPFHSQKDSTTVPAQSVDKGTNLNLLA